MLPKIELRVLLSLTLFVFAIDSKLKKCGTGSNVFSKASFVSSTADQDVDIHDPNFWTKMVGNTVDDDEDEFDLAPRVRRPNSYKERGATERSEGTGRGEDADFEMSGDDESDDETAAATKKTGKENARKPTDSLTSKKTLDKIINLSLTYPGSILRSGWGKIADNLGLTGMSPEMHEEIGHIARSYAIKCALLEADNLATKKSAEAVATSFDGTVLQTYPFMKQLLTEIAGEPVKMDTIKGDFNVEKILGKKTEGGKVLYHVKWQGYEEDSNTWEPASNFLDKHVITQYELELEAAEKTNIKEEANDAEVKEETGDVDMTAPVASPKSAVSTAKMALNLRTVILHPCVEAAWLVEGQGAAQKSVPGDSSKTEGGAPKKKMQSKGLREMAKTRLVKYQELFVLQQAIDKLKPKDPETDAAVSFWKTLPATSLPDPSWTSKDDIDLIMGMATHGHFAGIRNLQAKCNEIVELIRADATLSFNKRFCRSHTKLPKDWKVTGHANIGCMVMRQHERNGEQKDVTGYVTAWIPEEDKDTFDKRIAEEAKKVEEAVSPGEEAKTSTSADQSPDNALWRMVHEDGDVEDLEEFELTDALEMVKAKHGGTNLEEAPFKMKVFPDVAQLSKRVRDLAKYINNYFSQKDKRSINELRQVLASSSSQKSSAQPAQKSSQKKITTGGKADQGTLQAFKWSQKSVKRLMDALTQYGIPDDMPPSTVESTFSETTRPADVKMESNVNEAVKQAGDAGDATTPVGSLVKAETETGNPAAAVASAVTVETSQPAAAAVTTEAAQPVATAATSVETTQPITELQRTMARRWMKITLKFFDIKIETLYKDGKSKLVEKIKLTQEHAKSLVSHFQKLRDAKSDAVTQVQKGEEKTEKTEKVEKVVNTDPPSSQGDAVMATNEDATEEKKTGDDKEPASASPKDDVVMEISEDNAKKSQKVESVTTASSGTPKTLTDAATQNNKAPSKVVDTTTFNGIPVVVNRGTQMMENVVLLKNLRSIFDSTPENDLMFKIKRCATSKEGRKVKMPVWWASDAKHDRNLIRGAIEEHGISFKDILQDAALFGDVRLNFDKSSSKDKDKEKDDSEIAVKEMKIPTHHQCLKRLNVLADRLPSLMSNAQSSSMIKTVSESSKKTCSKDTSLKRDNSLKRKQQSMLSFGKPPGPKCADAVGTLTFPLLYLQPTCPPLYLFPPCPPCCYSSLYLLNAEVIHHPFAQVKSTRQRKQVEETHPNDPNWPL